MALANKMARTAWALLAKGGTYRAPDLLKLPKELGGESRGGVCAFTNCRGDEGIDAKRSRPSIGKPVLGHARKSACFLFGTDPRITSGPAAIRPHFKRPNT